MPTTEQEKRPTATVAAKLILYATLSVLLICLLLMANSGPSLGKVLAPLLMFLTYRALLAWRAIRQFEPGQP